MDLDITNTYTFLLSRRSEVRPYAKDENQLPAFFLLSNHRSHEYLYAHHVLRPQGYIFTHQLHLR